MSAPSFPSEAHAEFLALAMGAAKEITTPEWPLADLVLELDRGGRTSDAILQLRAITPWIAASATERLGRAAFAAEHVAPLLDIAERGRDRSLVAAVRKELAGLCAVARTEIVDVPSLAAVVWRVARTTGDEPTSKWLAGATGEAKLAIDLARLQVLKEAGDPEWEQLFESLEERFENLGSAYQDQAYRGLFRCGLTRAAHRHWARGAGHLDARLLAALWRENLDRPYRIMLDVVRTRWIDTPPRDWSNVSTAVDLAMARRDAGDVDGSIDSAKVARALAEENAATVRDPESTMSAEVAVWSLAPLIPMEKKFGDESRARELYADCRAMIDAPEPSNVGRTWRKKAVRRTTIISLSRALRGAGWYGEAFALARSEESTQMSDRHRTEMSIAAECGDRVLARSVMASLDDPRLRLELALAVCRACKPA